MVTSTRSLLTGLPRNPTAWVMLGLVVVSFLQRPGRTTFDTKLDLVVDPFAFLARALHLWNPEATSGELQNQAYGYLFPMGPFFGILHAIGIPPWISQRLWCAVLLCLAFAGTLLLARALRVGTEPARYAGALGYALAPRMLTEIGPLSAEMLPAVLLPWVLLPLVRAGKLGSPRRAAGLSALAVLCMGGVNAAMVVMALVLPGLWLLTRRWTREHGALVLWWGAGVLLAALWWILPLLLLGEYSLPFLNYIESSTNTTAPNSLFQVLRGTNQWIAYVVQGTPWWPSGFLLIDNPALMLATGLVAAIGLAGLARGRLPERRFLTLGVLVGLALLTVGYVGTLDSPLAEATRELLNGPLAALRNVHKFEPVLRLPLMLAFMHAISGRLPGLAGSASARSAPWVRSALWATRTRLAAGFLAVLVMAAPAWLGTLRPGPGWPEVPGYWSQAMDWLGDADPTARTLLLPSTSFGEYTWGGRTVDEPAQALATAPWAVRGQIPLGSEGNTRLMDSVDDVLSSGRGSAGLADLLARSGFRYLLLRNDIDRTSTGAPPAATLRAGLAASPGIERVAAFGQPIVPAGPVDQQTRPVPPLEVFQVAGPVPLAGATAAADLAIVSGGPESLVELLQAGLLERDRPTVLAGDAGAPQAGQWLVTDGLRHRERNVGRVRDNLSQTLAASEPPRQARPAIDVLPVQGLDHQTVAAYRGIRSVTASTSASFADSVSGSDPSGLPFAAIDGDERTAWRSSGFTGPDGQWLEVDLDTPRVLTDVTVRMVDDLRVGWPVTRIRISTDAGSVEHEVARGTAPQNLVTAPGLTSTVRVTVLSVAANRQNGNVGIAELAIPGVAADRALRVPVDLAPADGQRVSYSFSRGPIPRYPCLVTDDGPRCAAELARTGEEPAGIHRLFRTDADANYLVAGTVLPVPGGLSPVRPPDLDVSASSQLGGDQVVAPVAAVDGDPATTWIAGSPDLRPTLRLVWQGPRRITGLVLSTDPASGATRPAEVDIRGPAGQRKVRVGEDGRVELDLRTDRLEIAVTGVAGTDGSAGPAGISEVRLLGADDLTTEVGPDTRFTVPCGTGPKIDVDGLAYDTSISGTLADLRAHRPLPLRTCRDLTDGLDLPAGEHELRTLASSAFVVQDLWLSPSAGAPAPPRHREVTVGRWDATERELTVGPGPAAVLSVAENANDGWVATVDGVPLAATRVDGWQQAWLLPEGTGGAVRLEFVPDDDYRTRLLVGGLGGLGLLAMVVVPVRRRSDRLDTGQGGARWVPIALIALLIALAGMLPVVALIGCLLLRVLWRPAPVVLAFGGVAAAGLIAVTGRLAGAGQAWAYGFAAQAAVLVAAAAVVSAGIDWFEQRDRPASEP